MIVVESLGEKSVKCGKCKSLLRYDQTDVKTYKTNYDYLGDYDTVTGIECPVCENIIKDR
jgi:uncharacterized C2H2 Zn-finger protein